MFLIPCRSSNEVRTNHSFRHAFTTMLKRPGFGSRTCPVVGCFGSILVAGSILAASTHLEGSQPPAARLFTVPMNFEANAGQTDEQVKYLARGPGYALFLTDGEIMLALRRDSKKSKANRPQVQDATLGMKILG